MLAPTNEVRSPYEGTRTFEPGGPVDEPSFVLGAVGAYLNEVRNSERYIVHNRNVRDVFEAHGFINESMEMQAGVHDLVEGLFSDDPEVRSDTQNFIGILHESMNPESRTSFVIGLGYAISGVLWEAETAEAWREPAETKVTNLEGLTEQERVLLKAAISKNLPEGIDQEAFGQLLKRNPLLDLDMGSLGEATDRRDIQGLLGKSAELIDNLRNRPPDNPASVWRDCIEALTCFVPVLDLSGYSQMATELNGLVYEYLLEDHTEEAEKAQRQLELSLSYHDQVEVFVNTAIDQAAVPEDGVQESEHPLDIKTLGSMMQKFSEKTYKDIGADLLHDGLRTRIIVSDEAFTIPQMEDFMNRIREQISKLCETQGITAQEWHPIANSVSKNYMIDPKPNAYMATHLTYRLNINGVLVPFEIQTIGVSQNQLRKFGPSSHLLYKFAKKGVETTEDDLHHLRSFEGRARHLAFRPEHPVLNPNTWIEVLRRLPDLETPLHEVYAVNDAGYLVPKQLGNFELSEPLPDVKNNVFLPPSHLTVEQFKFMISLLDPVFLNNDKVNHALSIIQERHTGTRRDGVTSDIEGHLLPAALHGALLATASGRRWESENEESTMVNTIVAILLHDLVEDTFDNNEEGIRYIESEFDPEMASIVGALTSPRNVESLEQLRQLSAAQLEDIPEAKYYKLSDRMQNHTIDLVRMWSQRNTITIQELDKFDEYMQSTDRYLAEVFDTIPEGMYRETRAVIQTIYNQLKVYVHGHQE